MYVKGSLGVLPTFVGPGGGGSPRFVDVAGSPDAVHHLDLDPVALASMLSFQYVVDGRTPLAHVRRPSWLDLVGAHPGAGLGAVADDTHGAGRRGGGGRDPARAEPAGVDGAASAALATYGRRLVGLRAAAAGLVRHLSDEIERAFASADRVTLLLSGGLDSRLSSAVLVGLARRGRVTDSIRAVTWGIPESRDRAYGAQVARALGVEWVPVDLGPDDLAANIETCALELGALMSPVHLHATAGVGALDWSPGDKILVSTLGNGIGRGVYLHRHITYTRAIAPADWLGLLRPDVARGALDGLQRDLAAFRLALAGRAQVAVHECEMLAHFVTGSLLSAFGPLSRRAAPVHQALSDPATYGFLWSLSPLLRRESLYRAALDLAAGELAGIPDAVSNRPPRRYARRAPTDHSAFVHRYPRWLAHELADRVDALLSPDWFDATGVLDGAAVVRAWRRVRGQACPHPQVCYLLAWLCSLRTLGEALRTRPGVIGPASEGASAGASQAPDAEGPESRGPDVEGPDARDDGSDGWAPLPWGFGGRPAEPRWRRLLSAPLQGLRAARCVMDAARVRW